MRKSLLLILLFISVALITTSCAIGNGRINVDKEAEKLTEELMECLGNNDTKGLKELFCDVVAESDGFDDDLKETVEFFEGEVDSYNIDGKISEESKDDGKYSMAFVAVHIKDVKTSDGKTYKVRFDAFLVNQDNPEYVGISEINIESDDESEFKLGDYNLTDPQ